ncbi:AraC family transcriptional regulator [Arthrobacter sp. M4]|uniref:helix-turn-helix domain-containing protein n=1 Tax=Arthrobacter sp. M4 TaxID=218160 RepID=UPI001CDC2806|nr:AraC family transcriptional regulator [Arthrobacter sp. M4]MCA4132587.1 AraC family transcriptional regulator [Arthrobacter sp. M4]
MDDPLNELGNTGDDAASAGGGPAVVGANWYQFRPGQRISVPRVDGVSLIWVLEGGGELKLPTARFRVSAGMSLRVPWRSAIEYRADERAPFRTGAVHLVPWHAPDVEVTPQVAVEGGDLFDVPWRRGTEGAPPPALLATSSERGRRIISLATYCVERFLASAVTDPVARALGVLMHDAHESWDGGGTLEERPSALARMMDYVSRNLDRPLTIAEIARAGGTSPATAQRAFRRWTGESVLAWVRSRRMHEAARLLHTTGLRVGEVAHAVGFDDPLYFSRVFAKTYGVAPSKYAGGIYSPPAAPQ